MSPTMRTSQNTIKYPVPNCHRKNPCDRNGVQLRFHICESMYHMVQTAQKRVAHTAYAKLCYINQTLIILSN